MSFIYALVFKGKDTYLAEYAYTTGNFKVITSQILHQIQISSKQRFTTDQYNFDFLKEGALTFMALTEIGVEIELVYSFLTEMRQNFISRFSYQRIQEANQSYGFDDEFSPTIRLIMIRYNTDGHKIKTKAIIQDLDELKNVVVQNLADILERGEKLEILVDKADRIEVGSKTYKKNVRIIFDLGERTEKENDSKKYRVLYWGGHYYGGRLGLRRLQIVVYIILVLCCGWKVDSC